MPDPDSFDRAIRSYWRIRQSQTARQLDSGKVDAGLRGAVTGGAHLDALAQLLERLFVEAGFPAEAVRRATSIELPGYYRPTKRWDLVVVYKDTLVAAIELKSQVGPSFGNNFNNRVEEGLGNAVDIWRAYEEGTFGGIRPWLGYVFLLEATARSTSPVRIASSMFAAEPIFHGTSYAERYQIYCRRLVRERLYDAACFVMSTADPAEPILQPEAELSFTHFTAAIAGRAAYVLAAT